MVESQAQAQEYHRNRFGEMPDVGFAMVPQAERPVSYFVRRKRRTDW